MRKQTATFNKHLKTESLVNSPYGYPLALVSYVHTWQPEKSKVKFSDHTKTTFEVSLTPTQWAKMWVNLARGTGEEYMLKGWEATNDSNGLIWLVCGDDRVQAYRQEKGESSLDTIKRGYAPLPLEPVYGQLWVKCPELAKL